MYESIVKGQHKLETGTPESFNVLVKELQGLCLDIQVVKTASEQQEAERAEKADKADNKLLNKLREKKEENG